MEEHTHETAPSFSSSATPVVGYKADNSDITFYLAYLEPRRLFNADNYQKDKFQTEI